MKSEIIQKFKGKINGVEIENINTFYSTQFLLEQIENKFGEVYNNEFVEDLSNTIEMMYLKYDDFSYSELENEFYSCINATDKFNDIEFTYFGSDWKIEHLNECIKNNKYVEEKDVIIDPWKSSNLNDLER